MKQHLKQVSRGQFKGALAAYRENSTLGFTGPFIHSAPKGNMFHGPFEERAWMLGSETVLIKRRSGDGDWEYFASASDTGGPS